MRLKSWIVVLFIGLPGLASAQEDKVIQVHEDDPAMNAAIDKARASLPLFWEKFAAAGPGEDGFTLKLKLSDGDNVEHFWCDRVEGNAEASTCTIANEPQHVMTVRSGERIDVDPARISDWMYMLNGKIKGGETIRVLLRELPEEEAASIRDMLSTE